MFLTVFHCFSPFYAQERIAPIDLRYVSLFKEWPWAIRSRCSFAHKKWAIPYKNQKANSQPWILKSEQKRK